MRDDESIDYVSAAFAALASLCLHALLVAILPDSFQTRLPEALKLSVPIEVVTKPLVIPEERLPPVLRYAETNSQANRAIPEKAPFVSSRNQTAAQPVPEKAPSKSSLPKSAGTEENLVRVAQGIPRAMSEPAVSEVQPGTPSAVVGPLPGKTPDPVAKPAEKTVEKVAETPAPRNPERPRASVPSGTTGLLLRNNVGVNRAGAVAIDARFSNYGDYMQRMMEAIQSCWWDIIERSRFETVSRGRVVVRFKLHRDGTVTDAVILRYEVPRIMSLACKDSVMASAPFDAWRSDMVAMFGEEDMVTITFHYL